ncbi:class I SAM-dependent methyltransferase [uncultured Cohaesibacter sp.]|uniref:class I SAM-dependent methyltransferase n=1 Tax=uncultured Cohaesibacter sp. TaxID=1002546 RepID=UPI002AAB1679|nr:class I SAM-dependent methyltransferase [uncultured Cohaesibacter sp.]
MGKDARTNLKERLKRMIRATGPISVADYMSLCLSDPQDGYYTSQQPIGSAGDFITAPEISQLFGELLGIWMLAIWQQSGRPKPFHLVELGPGRGTLMSDMIRAIATDRDAAMHLHVHLVEISPTLKREQNKALADFDVSKEWHTDFASLPEAPLFIVGNEFFDCLPIHQWVFHKGRWHERVIGLDAEDHLCFGLGPVRDLGTPQEAAEDGAILERAPASDAMMGSIGAHLASHGGAGLFIDYGYDTPAYGDTFQAMRHHAYADPLANPGTNDLTAHVNFTALRNRAKEEFAGVPSCRMIAPPVMTQGDFLLAMGLLQRAGQIGAGRSQQVQERISQAVERLASPEQMGSLFKCLALMPEGTSLPPATLT